MEFKGCQGYTLIESKELTDIDSKAFVLKHDKSGARVVLIQNKDDNKNFSIGFRTPQHSSNGLPHILEHCVLCGSDKYPVKDAMAEVDKGSLNTFMNAFTYPDRTVYPVASCNDKDFANLMEVYLDAVFSPTVHKEKKIFMQEGWHYELDNKEDDITINGVVYNEMKGVYSSPEQAISSYIQFSLFPDTQYGVEYGGAPEIIPELKYEDFLAFHKKMYHPSNSYIYLYGDMDFEERLAYLDREYLSKYDAIKQDSDIEIQKPFEKPVHVEKDYPISETDSEKDATFLTYNVVCADYTDKEINEAIGVINYALCSVPGAKLKERLIDAGIGKDVYSIYNVDVCQKYFSIVAQNANAEDEERFVAIVEDTMREIIEEGFDKKALEAAIGGAEFAYKEADFGYYPKGVLYGMKVTESWLYTDEDFFGSLEMNTIFPKLRESIDQGYFEKILKERILENNHKSILVMKPRKNMAEEQDEKLANKLASCKASLSEKQLEHLIQETTDYRDYQEKEDTKENLDKIPTLSIKDMNPKNKETEYKVVCQDGVPEIFVDMNTNGIAYIRFCFDITKIPLRLMPYLSIYKLLLGFVDTKKYKYSDLINETNIQTGGISVNTSIYKDYEDSEKYSIQFELKTKVLYDKIPEAIALAKEILFTSNIEDSKRIKDILEESKSRLQGYLMSSGHAVAINRALSYIHSSVKANEVLSGMDQFRFIEKLTTDFEGSFEDLVKGMKEVEEFIYRKEHFEISVGANKEGFDLVNREMKEFVKMLFENKPEGNQELYSLEKQNEAYSCTSAVQYVACVGNFKQAGLKYTGSLQAVRSILSIEYLWNTVRLQGGAYGCMCGIGRGGDVYMVSYRDPKLKETLEIYKKAADYIENYEADEEVVQRFVISAIGGLDMPLNPSTKEAKAYSMYKSNMTDDDLQTERDELLSTTLNDIHKGADYLRAAINGEIICTVGGEKTIVENRQLFGTVESLYKKD